MEISGFGLVQQYKLYWHAVWKFLALVWFWKCRICLIFVPLWLICWDLHAIYSLIIETEKTFQINAQFECFTFLLAENTHTHVCAYASCLNYQKCVISDSDVRGTYIWVITFWWKYLMESICCQLAKLYNAGIMV